MSASSHKNWKKSNGPDYFPKCKIETFITFYDFSLKVDACTRTFDVTFLEFLELLAKLILV